MDFTSLYKAKDTQARWVDIVFYAASLMLVIAIFCYCIFAIKIYFQNQSLAAMDEKIALYGTQEQKATEQAVMDYKKKIDDFAIILDKHTITSNVFAFIEKNTLPNIWFSNFDMSSTINEIRLSGEADTAETLSRQVKLFEDSKEYVRNISVLNTQIGASGKIVFTLDLFVNAKIFEYVATPQTALVP